jgi:hypothetical protein
MSPPVLISPRVWKSQNDLPLSAGTTSHVLTDLESGVTYYYRVRAINACGMSDYSDTITALTPQVLAAWDVSGLTGGSGNYGASPLAPTTYEVGDVTVVGLTRGAGVTQVGTAVARGWGGTAWNSANVPAMRCRPIKSPRLKWRPPPAA